MGDGASREARGFRSIRVVLLQLPTASSSTAAERAASSSTCWADAGRRLKLQAR